MATHSNILAWRIPGTEEPGRLQSMGSVAKDTSSIVLVLINWDVLYEHPNAVCGSLRFNGSP